MKTNHLLSALLVLATLAGCAKEMVENPGAAPAALGTQTFTATVETPVPAASTKSFDGTIKAFQFKVDDEIAISDGTTTSVFTATEVADGNVTFTIKADETPLATEGVTYKAYYPASIAPGKSGVEGQTGMYMMQQQITGNGETPEGKKINYAPSLYEANPMYAEATTTELYFTNLCGLIQLNVSQPEGASDIAISQIIMESYAGNLFGPCSVSDGKMVFTEDAGYTRIAAKNTNAKWLSANSVYYIAVPEGDYSDVEFMVVTNTRLYQHYRMKASSTLSIQRNKVYTLNLVVDDLRIDLTDNKEISNCYLVKAQTAGFVFKAARGTETDFLTGIDGARLLWKAQSTSSDLEAKIVSNDVRYDNGYIYFDGVGNQGNVLIAATNGDDIVWSWHIWLVAESTFPTDQTYPSGKVVMDRNIGAFNTKQSGNSINAAGLLYQWGRKDPFPGRGGNTATALTPQYGSYTTSINTDGPVTVAVAYAHPNVFYANSSAVWTNEGAAWNGEAKTIHDPCPQGYRVWDNTAWGETINKDDFSTNVQVVSGTTKQNAGFIYQLGNDATAYYACNGQMNNKTGAMGSGTTQHRTWFRTVAGGKIGFYNLTQTGDSPDFKVNAASLSATQLYNSSYGMGVRCEKIQ